MQRVNSHELDLGVTGLRPLPELTAAAHAWPAAWRRMEDKVFLRSEGQAVTLGPPQELDERLAAEATRLVAAFSAFSTCLVEDYYRDGTERDDYLINDLFAPLFEVDREGTIPVPANRLDCVLDRDGRLVVIENNSVGICLYHYRNILYLIRGLARSGLGAAAERLDVMARELSDGFRRAYRSRAADVRDRPTLGILVPTGMLRAGGILFRAALERTGWHAVVGSPRELTVDTDAVRLRGHALDLLWSDVLFYFAYQQARYAQTRFPTRLGEFDDTPHQVAQIVGDPRFLDHLRRGRVVNVSPATAYLALPKPLLARVHHRSPALAAPELAWLREHVARSYALAERDSGVLSREQAEARQAELVLKPALYGGSFGVVIGKTCANAEWRAKLDEIWSDRSWLVQEYLEPVRTASGDWLSVGLCGFGGRFAGAILRTAPDVMVSARDSALIAALAPSQR